MFNAAKWREKRAIFRALETIEEPVPASDEWPNYDRQFSPLIQQIGDEMREARKNSYCELKPSDSQTFKALKSWHWEDTKVLCDWLVDEILRSYEYGRCAPRYRHRGNPYYLSENPANRTFVGLMRRKQKIPVNTVLGWFEKITQHDDGAFFPEVEQWPCAYMVQQIERQEKTTKLTRTQINRLKAISKALPVHRKPFYFCDLEKVKDKIDRLTDVDRVYGSTSPSYKKLSGDNFGRRIKIELEALADQEAANWNILFIHASKATGSKPGKEFLDATDSYRQQFGRESVRKMLHH